MNYEEALNELKYDNDERDWNNCMFDMAGGVYEKCVEALEKQIPKKPTHLQFNPDGFMTLYCPNCGDFHRSEFAIKFCSDCGQAIDWSYDVDTEYEAYQDEMGGMAEVVASEVE